MNNIQKYKAEFETLVQRGVEIQESLERLYNGPQPTTLQNLKPEIESNYQRWFTESTLVIEQLLPGRRQEFGQLYEGRGGRRRRLTEHNYTIQDWLYDYPVPKVSAGEREGMQSFDDLGVVLKRFSTQLDILRSLEARIESTLVNIKQLVQADLFDSETDAAQELVDNGFGRAAGAVAGVVLERHLAQVADNHSVELEKKKHTIGDLNKRLRAAGVLDIPSERRIRGLADIRNQCVHYGDTEPKEEDVKEMIRGVNRIIHTLS